MLKGRRPIGVDDRPFLNSSAGTLSKHGCVGNASTKDDVEAVCEIREKTRYEAPSVRPQWLISRVKRDECAYAHSSRLQILCLSRDSDLRRFRLRSSRFCSGPR